MDLTPNRSVWQGDKTNGIEFRYQEKDLDEIVMYIDGKCVLHIERMYDTNFWMGLYSEKHTAHVHMESVNGKSHVHLTVNGTWDKKCLHSQ